MKSMRDLRIKISNIFKLKGTISTCDNSILDYIFRTVEFANLLYSFLKVHQLRWEKQERGSVLVALHIQLQLADPPVQIAAEEQSSRPG